MARELRAILRRKPRESDVIAQRVTNELVLDRRQMRGKAARMEGVTVLNPGAAMLQRMRGRRVAKLKAAKRKEVRGSK